MRQYQAGYFAEIFVVRCELNVQRICRISRPGLRPSGSSTRKRRCKTSGGSTSTARASPGPRFLPSWMLAVPSGFYYFDEKGKSENRSNCVCKEGLNVTKKPVRKSINQRASLKSIYVIAYLLQQRKSPWYPPAPSPLANGSILE